MDIALSAADPLTVAADLLAFGVGTDLEGLDTLSGSLGAGLAAWAKASGFTGTAGTSLAVPSLGRLPVTHVLLVGVGGRNATELRKAAAKAGREARTVGARTAVLALGAGADPAQADALTFGNYTFDKYAKADDRKAPLQLVTWCVTGGTVDLAVTALREKWANQARDLINEPAAVVYPESLAEWARTNLGGLPGVTVEVWDEARLAAEGCVGILGVGQGSSRPPRLIRASYRHPGGGRSHIGLVGKGVTFDSGGHSLKPSANMQTMRCDMGGAATMLTTFGMAVEAGLPLDLDVWVGAVENMIDGNAYKLGDVFTYRNGVTVEIHNTDAEGRLVLADCLIHACAVPGVKTVVDAATLTGACVVAVGEDFTGLFTDDDGLASSLLESAAATGEGLWRLPLYADYKRLLKADWAQIKNIGGPTAGATTAALFLQYFVQGAAWAHLDIAGSSFHEKGDGRYAAGATGEPVRTLTHWLAAQAR